MNKQCILANTCSWLRVVRHKIGSKARIAIESKGKSVSTSDCPSRPCAARWDQQTACCCCCCCCSRSQRFQSYVHALSSRFHCNPNAGCRMFGSPSPHRRGSNTSLLRFPGVNTIRIKNRSTLKWFSLSVSMRTDTMFGMLPKSFSNTSRSTEGSSPPKNTWVARGDFEKRRLPTSNVTGAGAIPKYTC